MDSKEKEYKKLKFGLALKKAMKNFSSYESNVEVSKEQEEDTLSFRKLETNSGIPHPSIVLIVQGKKNPSWTTIDALLEGLEINLSEFGSIYDNLTNQEIAQFKSELDKKRLERETAKKRIAKKLKLKTNN